MRVTKRPRPPSAVWIKAIRQALGMSTAQFGRHMGVSQPPAVELQRAEDYHSVTPNVLQHLHCQCFSQAKFLYHLRSLRQQRTRNTPS